MTACMTREQWAALEVELRTPYGYAKLQADGRVLTLNVQRVKGLQYAIAVYIDGSIKGEWMSRDSEVGAKFWRPRATSLYSANSVKRVEKKFGKRIAARMKKEDSPKLFMHDPYFPSVAVLRRHLAKTCTSVEMIKCGFSSSPAEVPA